MLENKLFKFEEGVVSRWASYENPDGAKGAGGTVRNGRKGAPWFTLNPGESRVLAHAENTSGIIRRMWITISDQTPETLRGIKLEMFWDNSENNAFLNVATFPNPTQKKSPNGTLTAGFSLLSDHMWYRCRGLYWNSMGTGLLL